MELDGNKDDEHEDIEVDCNENDYPWIDEEDRVANFLHNDKSKLQSHKTTKDNQAERLPTWRSTNMGKEIISKSCKSS